MRVPVIPVDRWSVNQTKMAHGFSMVLHRGVLAVPSPKHQVSMLVCLNLPRGFGKQLESDQPLGLVTFPILNAPAVAEGKFDFLDWKLTKLKYFTFVFYTFGGSDNHYFYRRK